MHLLSAENLSINRGGRLLLESAGFGMESEDKIGLIAPNGAGKTSLLNCLSGKLAPTEGSIHYRKNLKISVLSQRVEHNDTDTVFDYIYNTDNPRMNLLRAYEKSLDMKDVNLYQELLHRMDEEDLWSIESKVNTILKMLGITDGNLLLKNMSGGMKRRAALAAALAAEADILFLDEPTNHLDLETVVWLQEYLQNLDSAVFLITHDRYFLEEVCSQIWEIESAELYRYPGNYSAYIKGRMERLAARQREQQRLSSILRREEAWLRQGPKARSSRDKKRLEKLYDLRERITAEDNRSIEFATQDTRLGKKILKMSGISKSYRDRTIVSDFTYEFNAGQRIGLVGSNGSGKTTLMNLIAGVIEPESGEVNPGINTVFGYFSQTFSAHKPEMTVLDYLEKIGDTYNMPDGSSLTPETLLDRFLFPRELHRVPLEQISGGELRRLYFVSILLTSPNFLLLDEPTNDLDITTLQVLEDFLESFKGCVITVSHDRAFLDRVSNILFVLDGTGSVLSFGGSCSDYLELKKEQDAAVKEEARQQKIASAAVQTRRREEKPKLTFNEKRSLEALEAELPQLETEKSELEDYFSTAFAGSEEYKLKHQRYEKILKEIDEKFELWAELSEKL